MGKPVYVLNADFLPINRVEVKRAKHMIETGKAYPVDYIGDPADIRKSSFVPKKIKLYDLNTKMYGQRAKYNKAHLVERDGNRCMYCGKEFSSKRLEIEHVMPSSRGGKTEWENIVSACRECNQKKADMTPEEAGMGFYKPGFRPYTPMMYEFITKRSMTPEYKMWLESYKG